MFRHQFRVRYAETDLQGVVFNSRYLEYADLLITEYWREIGLQGPAGILEFHVARATVDFRAPIRSDEMIEGRAWTERIGTSSVTTRFELHGMTASSSDDLRAEMVLVHVHVDLASGKAVPVPGFARVLLLG